MIDVQITASDQSRNTAGAQQKFSNTNRIHIEFSYKFFVSFYISNKSLHFDLKISTVTELAKLHYKRFNNRLNRHSNLLIS